MADAPSFWTHPRILNGHPRPSRVTFVIGKLDPGGAETQLIRLANGLDRSRFVPSIVCLESDGDLDATLAADVAVTKLGLGRVTGRPVRGRAILATRIVAALISTFRRHPPDVVHAYLPAAYVLGGLAARLAQIRVVIAGRRGLTTFEGYQRVIGLVANRYIDMHVCNSNAVRDYAIAKERLPLDRTRVIHNGIDLPTIGTAVELPAEWESKGVKAAMVANLRPYKGHQEVLQAVARVVKSHPEFRLVLIGDGTESASLASLSNTLGIVDNVVFAGRRRDAAKLMSGFDFTLLGSSQEGFPNVLMESMARAVPVVSTAVGGVTELVAEGVHGHLVPFGNIEAMSRAIHWMIERPEERRRMGEMGRRRIAQEFSTERMINATEAVYEELLGRPAPVAVPG